MSPVIAFDIAVVAQKVKVQCCYIMAEMLNLKKWGGCWVSNRSGWLLELLTELTTLDFYFLSHYSYIKSNHWAHLLTTFVPYVQDSAR